MSKEERFPFAHPFHYAPGGTMTTLARITAAVTHGNEYKARAEVIPAVPARYPAMAHLIADARDAYLIAAAAAGLPTEGLPEITTLGRILRGWIDALTDTSVTAVAIGAGFPAHLAPMVSVRCLRAWLTLPAYGDDAKLNHILNTARKRYAEAYPDLATPCHECDADPGEECRGDCLVASEFADHVPDVAEIVSAADTPASWLVFPPNVIRALALHQHEVKALHLLAIESGDPNAVVA
ncbi:hypothetical protein GCM10027187_40370 [Streptosporangium sandarakinum]|uniref:Uncharacterized protein n=1 Tax=Streptosporangium sandarakinum TaxID=1260955 RepID=A0A852V4H4_9ACTN|nr:hypothetical protein [Streptosporangium sandarakinum]NYF44632.1 hypothetical protein [Streptosporangium sandarakinum]